MAATAPEVKSKRNEWVERNPLRMWRKSQGLTLMGLAPKLKVSMLCLQQWEAGSNRPNLKNMAALQRIMRDPVLPQRWSYWYSTCPSDLPRRKGA